MTGLVLLRLSTVAAAARAARAWQCATDIDLGSVRSASQKGIALDDYTLRWCSQRIPAAWPNAEDDSVSYLRLFKAWDPQWEEADREAAWEHLRAYTELAGAKVFLGTPVSCSEEDDDLYWSWTKDLMRVLGAGSVMGLSIGNELELLQFKGGNITEECVERIWDGGYLWSRFTAITAELDSMGFSGVPVTSVFTGAALSGSGNRVQPFLEDPKKARVNTFLSNATQAYGFRFVFVWNLYPYFDPNLQLDAGTDDSCEDALGFAACWGHSCSVPATARYARYLQYMLTDHKNHTMWIGETGWSYPRAETLHTSMKPCDDWSSMETFQNFYQGFLDWDLVVDHDGATDGEWAGPDVAFWFTMRDSIQFGYAENFGLISTCSSPECKLHTKGFEVASYERVPDAPEGHACGGEGDPEKEFLVDNGQSECQDRCTLHPECSFYSFWNSSGWCRLTSRCCFVPDQSTEEIVVHTSAAADEERCQATLYERVAEAPQGYACRPNNGSGPGEEFAAAGGQAECQARCTLHPDCAFYSFWNSSGWCRLTSQCCLVFDENPEAVISVFTGAPDEERCSEPFPAPFGKVADAPEGHACAAEEGGGTERNFWVEHGRAECQARCADLDDCAYFSFWSSAQWCRLTARCCLVPDENREVMVYTNVADKDTCSEPTPPTTTAPPPVVQVVVRLTLSGFDYNSLVSDEALKAEFVEGIRAAVVGLAGGAVTEGDVEVTLSAGSVAVVATITPSSDVSAKELEEDFTSKQEELQSSIIARVTAIEGIDAVTTGGVGAGGVEVGTETKTQTTTAREEGVESNAAGPVRASVLPATFVFAAALAGLAV